MNKYLWLFKVISLVFCMTLSNISQADHSHVHGQSLMTIVLDEKQLIINISIAAHDLLGFENKPTTNDEQSALNKAVKKLTATDQWLTIKNGQCSKVEDKLINPFTDNSPNLDFNFSSIFACQSPQDIKKIKIMIHQQFKKIIETEVQWIFDNKQGFVSISQHQDTIVFK